VKNAFLLLLLLLSSVSNAEDVVWQKELADAKSVEVAWEDLAGPPVKKTLTGDGLKKLQRHFPEKKSASALCRYHRDASFTLPGGRRIDLCFGCGIARTPDLKDFPFDKEAVRALYVSLLGEQPAQKTKRFEGY